MSRRPNNALSAARVRTAKSPGRYADGNGLYLVVEPTGNKRWIQRLTILGRRTDLGLGGYPLVSLGEAREKAFVNRKLAREGGDPRDGKRREAIPIFAEAAKRVIEIRRSDWRHPEDGQTMGSHAEDLCLSFLWQHAPRSGERRRCAQSADAHLD